MNELSLMKLVAILWHHNPTQSFNYHMAGNFGGEFILADWRFWEQSANISSAKKLHSNVIIIAKSFSCVARPAAKRASLIVGKEFTIESCVRWHHFFKEFCTPDGWEKSWLVCQQEEGDLNDRYAVAIKTDATKTVEIKCNNNLSSFQLQFIINFF